MEVSKLLNDIASYIKLVKNKDTFVKELLRNIGGNISVVREQLDVLSSTKQATVPQNIIRQYPDIKIRVTTNLSNFIDEEISEIQESLDQLKELTTEFEKLYYKIDKSMSQIDWNKYIDHYSAFTQITEWSENCWKYFYFIYLEISNGLRLFHLDDTHSDEWIKNVECIDGINKRYVFDNPIMDMFQMLKKDFSSRDKITINSFDCDSKIS